jgi:hypothetical protein|tara:strand:+ start:3149 stop:3430 length:282 start_codon:yes stop_codon:yes gene_type:complete
MKNNQVKLTTDELAEILALNTEYQEVLISLGQINLRRDSIEKEEASLKVAESEHYDSYDETQKKEANFKQRIVRKYGQGEIDLETGVYTKSKK